MATAKKTAKKTSSKKTAKKPGKRQYNRLVVFPPTKATTLLSDTVHTDDQVQEYMNFKKQFPTAIAVDIDSYFKMRNIYAESEVTEYYTYLSTTKESDPVDMENFFSLRVTDKETYTNTTDKEYHQALELCKIVFAQKIVDYGSSWRIFRLSSLVDQIFIKAFRIRTLQEKKTQKVSDPVVSEFIGIVNYGIIMLIQNKIQPSIADDPNTDGLGRLYDDFSNSCYNTMLQKNHDYGEAWRYMGEESFTDMILVKLKRVQQIIRNGTVKHSEPLDASLVDIINYALFAIIRFYQNK